MRTARFSCSERLLCNIAGVDFNNLNVAQRNQVRILNMYMNTPETYHSNITQELKPFADNVNLEIGDIQVDTSNGVSYYPITAAGNSVAVPVKLTVDEMAEKIATRLSLPLNIITQWDDNSIETAFNNLNLNQRPKTSRNIVGYLLVSDKGDSYTRFKASTDDVSNITKLYADYVAQQEALISAPTSN